MTIVSPLIYKQKTYSDYGVCEKTGTVYSKKFGYWKPLKWKISGGCKYPQVSLSNNRMSKTISVHIAVHETLNPNYPIPPGVMADDWKKTPQAVKSIIRELFQVNHIDHNHRNFNPENLEWVTAMQNVQKYQKFRVGECA